MLKFSGLCIGSYRENDINNNANIPLVLEESVVHEAFAGEMAQWLRALVEDTGSFSSK